MIKLSNFSTTVIKYKLLFQHGEFNVSRKTSSQIDKEEKVFNF